MEINFGLSGLLRGTGGGGQKDKNKPSKKKSNSSSSTSTLPRRWSFKLPKLVERKEERESGVDRIKPHARGREQQSLLRASLPPPRAHNRQNTLHRVGRRRVVDCISWEVAEDGSHRE